MMRVVDASIAIKWFVDEPYADLARTVLGSGSRLIAPELIIAEVGNAAWKKQRRGEMDSHQILHMVHDLPRLVGLVQMSPLMVRVMQIARQIDHPVYDCFYLALAESMGARLITADDRLIAKVAGSLWAKRVDSLYSLDVPL